MERAPVSLGIAESEFIRQLKKAKVLHSFIAKPSSSYFPLPGLPGSSVKRI
jgi:hypothetical protein